ncbi:methyl-accepting chemotaxis protein [Novipirellula sp. SH528]|uniref:methyl-accepting chemotaxis protein n=1 Tax=Novipirellula sp. SH528 TaxID=3454466 RepID=UPI003F9F5DDF
MTPLAFSVFDILPSRIWNHHPFHAVVEGLGSFAALIVAVTMLMLRQQGSLTSAYVWVICGFIGMGTLDGIHAATHAGHVFVWLHSCATFVGGATFALVWLPDQFNRKVDVPIAALLMFAFATAFGCISLAQPNLLPAMKDDHGFTFAAKALNIGGGIGFLAATGFFLFRQHKNTDTLIFANLCLLFGVAGLIFERSVLWDSNWWLWHMLRLVAYGFVLYYFMAIFYRTLVNLKQTRDSLETRIADITIHESQLHQAHGNLEAILNSTADAIMTIDTNGEIETFNRRAETLFGYPRQEVIGNHLSTLIVALNGSKHESNTRFGDWIGDVDTLNRERELDVFRRDGSHVPILLRMTELKQGDRRQYICVAQDVSERKRIDDERKQIFNAVRETVAMLSTTSTELSASVVQQTRGSETQSAAVKDASKFVKEVACSTEDAAAMVSDVAKTALRADAVSKSGRTAVEETRVAMSMVRKRDESTATSMGRLAERAQAIATIITAVNDFADQTNILALNAAIEASRAGEAGRGFAVVAAEVKSLAEQAKLATAEVRNILSEILAATHDAILSTEQGATSVNEAYAVVMKAEQTIEELGTMVAASAEAASKIVTASKQQANSIHQVTTSMDQINQSAQDTLAATRQTENAANNLDALGRRLTQLIELRSESHVREPL